MDMDMDMDGIFLIHGKPGQHSNSLLLKKHTTSPLNNHIITRYPSTKNLLIQIRHFKFRVDLSTIVSNCELINRQQSGFDLMQCPLIEYYYCLKQYPPVKEHLCISNIFPGPRGVLYRGVFTVFCIIANIIKLHPVYVYKELLIIKSV